MQIEPTGVFFEGRCTIRSELCRAQEWGSLTAVFTTPHREQVDVCGACLQEMVRGGEWEIPGTRQVPRHDVAVLDEHGVPRLLIEVKAGAPKACADAVEWARRIHRNAVLYAGLPAGAAFMLVGYPDQFFLWNADAIRNPDSPPSHQVCDAGVLEPFLSVANGDAGPAAHERVVAAWVHSLLDNPSATADAPEWLQASVLLQELHDGFVARQLTVV
jgi:hypothetical protein